MGGHHERGLLHYLVLAHVDCSPVDESGDMSLTNGLTHSHLVVLIMQNWDSYSF